MADVPYKMLMRPDFVEEMITDDSPPGIIRLQIISARDCKWCPVFDQEILPQLLNHYKDGPVKVEMFRMVSMARGYPIDSKPKFLRKFDKWYPMVILIPESIYQDPQDLDIEDIKDSIEIFGGHWNSDTKRVEMGNGGNGPVTKFNNIINFVDNCLASDKFSGLIEE